MATVFYKEAMVWLSGRFLRVSAWRQFFNLAAYHFWRGEIHLWRAFPLQNALLWHLLGPFYNSSSMEEDCHCFGRLGIPSVTDTFFGCTVVGAGTIDCTWALDVETLPLVTLPWRGLFCCLLCLPSTGGFLLGSCGRVLWVCVKKVCVGVCGCVGVPCVTPVWGVGVRVCGCVGGCEVCVWVHAWLMRCWLESRCLHGKEPRKASELYVRRVFIMDDCDELIPE